MKKFNKKRQVFCAISALFLGVSGVYGYKYLKFNNIDLILSLEDNSLKWGFTDELSINNYSFKVVHNNNEIKRTTDCSFDNIPLSDKVKPNEPQNIKLDYQKEGVNVDWDKVVDIGEKNTYIVKLLNKKEKEIKTSNTIDKEYTSGLKEYVLILNNEEVKRTTDNHSFIDNELLLEGENTLTIKAVDNSGNSSESEIKILKYELSSQMENKVLKPIISDVSQSYKFILSINDTDVNETFDKPYDLSNILIDDVAPEDFSIKGSLKNNKVIYNWSTVDYGRDYHYQLIGIGDFYENKVYSEDEKYTSITGLKGYHYYFGEDANYKVTTDDTFTEKGYFEKENLEYKTYYLKVIAIDNAGNISNTASYKITNSAPKPADYKMDTIKNLFVKTGVSEQSINKYAKYIYDYVPQHILNAVVNDGVKIHLTDGNVRKYLLNNFGIEAGMELKGCFVNKPHNSILISSSSGMNVFLHEFSHAYDFSKSYSDYYSNTSEFLEIYRAESAKMFGANSYFSSNEREYYAESFYTYLTNRGSLKQKAPRTSEYFSRITG